MLPKAEDIVSMNVLKLGYQDFVKLSQNFKVTKRWTDNMKSTKESCNFSPA